MKTRSPRTEWESKRATRSPLAIAAGAMLVLSLLAADVGAFALLGPYADWMQPTNSYRMGWEVGGPVDIGQGYRWNVPVVTYGFDQSFMDYFGSNGVAAVEEAIKILNDLPPASALVASDFPTDSRGYNYPASYQGLCDLKSATLAFLLEQMGLAEPERSAFVLRRWNPVFLAGQDEYYWPSNTVPEFVVERNYDPETLTPSWWVNGNGFRGYVAAWGPLTPNPSLAFVESVLIDPINMFYDSAIANWTSFYRPINFGLTDGPAMAQGLYCTGLTWDDVGGLRYLLSPTNVNLEPLLPDVRGAGTNAGTYVNLAWRAGVDKITFLRQELDALGQPIPRTNQFTDTYITNGVTMYQQLERVIAQPDFLFCVADTGASNPNVPPAWRTDTSDWWNSASLSGSGAQGPGVIRPPVRITFDELGPVVQTDEDFLQRGTYWFFDFRWGSFGDPTNAIVAHPSGSVPAVTNQLPVHLWLLNPASGYVAGGFTWQTPVAFGGQARLETSTNLTDWVSVTTVSNYGGALTWRHWCQRPQRFFRVVPQ